MTLDELLKKRRAYRSLEPVEITESMINEMYEALKLAPSCFNNQPWRYVFAFEKEALEKTKLALTAGNVWATKASMIIAVLSHRDLDCKMPDGRDYYKFDTGMASALLILKATELGLVAHPIAGYDPAKVKDALNIPDPFEVLTIIIAGKKSEKVGELLSEFQRGVEDKRPERKPLGEVLFLNRFGG